MQKINSILSLSLFCIAAVVILAACTAVQESSSMAFDNANEVIRHYAGGPKGSPQRNIAVNNTPAPVVQQPTTTVVNIQEEDITHNTQSGGSSNYGAVTYQPTDVELIELGSEVKK